MNDHMAFVAASYAVSALALGVLGLLIVMGARQARARVEALEKGASNRIADAEKNGTGHP
jgi:heme exporter protein CcmD